MALAADRVYARGGVVLNPHYKGMGGLYGSEYWTYTLPRRVRQDMALRLTQGCAPLGTRKAKAVGLIDDGFGEDIGDFETHVRAHARALAQHPRFSNLLEAKQERRIADERRKPLASYRREELAQMRLNFYHEARRRFVCKGTVPHHPADQPEQVRHAVTSSNPEARA